MILNKQNFLETRSVFAYILARLYTVTVNEETQSSDTSETRDVELRCNASPVATTFGIFDE